MTITLNNECIYVHLDDSGILTYDQKVNGIFIRTEYPQLLKGYEFYGVEYDGIKDITKFTFNKVDK